MKKIVEVRGVKIGEGMPKVCLPICGRSQAEILAIADNISNVKKDLVELRIDWFDKVEDLDSVKALLGEVRAIFKDTPILFTFRTKKEGGEKEISPEDYVKLNLLAVESKLVDLVDVEAFTGEEYVKHIVENAHNAGIFVVGSNHDFDKTPSENEIVDRLKYMQELGVDIPKIAVMPNSKADVITLLSATEKMSREFANGPIITMSMGKDGGISRIAGEIFGSAVTFGAGEKASAPGQINSDKLFEILDMIHENL